MLTFSFQPTRVFQDGRVRRVIALGPVGPPFFMVDFSTPNGSPTRERGKRFLQFPLRAQSFSLWSFGVRVHVSFCGFRARC
jgi:hypothetical protein